MTIYYVGSGGNDGNAGTSWALRKLTLTGAEDIPVTAGDTVYVGPGTYREALTLDVSGSGGSPITYIGDYLGTNTDGVGGIVRITGSDNDQTATRTNCITTGGARNYRTFTGFQIDTCTGPMLTANGSQCTNWIVQSCLFQGAGSENCVRCNGQSNNWTIQNSAFFGPNSIGIQFLHTSTYDNSANLVQNCLFLSGATGILATRVGGVTVKNSVFFSRAGVRVDVALTAGQLCTVRNSVFSFLQTALQATTTAEFDEDFNNFWANNANRTNVNTGANSLTYPPLFDPRWFFQLVNAGAGPYSPLQLATPFDLASFSQLVNVAGTSPTTTDMRGTAVQGAQREWGALEYDSTLKIFGGIKKGRVRTGY